MKILNFPEGRQFYNYDCGANAMQSVLHYYGIEVREDKIVKIAKTTKQYWTSIKAMEKVAHTYNLKTTAKHMTITEVKKYIDKKIPVILLLQAWSEKKNTDWKNNRVDGHYVIAIWYGINKIYFEDPYSIYRAYLSFKELRDRRHDREQDGVEYHQYGIAVYGKEPVYDITKKIHME